LVLVLTEEVLDQHGLLFLQVEVLNRLVVLTDTGLVPLLLLLLLLPLLLLHSGGYSRVLLHHLLLGGLGDLQSSLIYLQFIKFLSYL